MARKKWPKEAPVFDHFAYGTVVGVSVPFGAPHPRYIKVLLCERENEPYTAFGAFLDPLTPAACAMLEIAKTGGK